MSTHKVSQQNDIFVTCGKRQYLMLQNSFAPDFFFFAFLHNQQKMYFSHKILCVNIACSDVHLGKNLNF
jgi:hypothetical protein